MKGFSTNRFSQERAARIAGGAYIVIMLASIVATSGVDPRIIVPGDHAATFSHIVADAFLFRVGIVTTLVVYAAVVVLSAALYVVLKPVQEHLALLALLLRTCEAVIGSITVFLSLIAGLLATDGAYSQPFTAEQVHALAALLLDVRAAGLDVVLVFVGLGGTIFAYLFLKSRYVPAALAAWGIFTYASMFVLGVLSIIWHDHPTAIEVILYSSGGLFELVFGVWLLAKGVDIEEPLKVAHVGP